MNKLVTKIGAAAMSIVMASACMLSAGNAFAAASPIAPLDNSVKMTFAAWGDPQVSTYIKAREPYVISSSNDLKNAQTNIDALVIAGDIAENGNQAEYDIVYNNLVGTGVDNFITATGNHDVRRGEFSAIESTFVGFTNRLNADAGSALVIDSLHYSYDVNGYRFIVLGTEKSMYEEASISEKQIKWLDSQLADATKSGKPAFVVMHQVLKDTHGLPDTWGGFAEGAGTVGEQSDEIKAVLGKYSNVILISGHLHTGLGKYSYEKIGNIHSINLPSIGVDNDMGTNNDNATGYVAEVYEGKVIFRARNFEKGEYIPEYDITIPLSKVKSIKAKSSFTYDGKTKSPKVTLTDFNGKKISSKNYTVKYPSSRKNVGTYQIKITFKNSLKNNPVLTKEFTIVPASTSITGVASKSKGFTVKWKKQTNQTSGYQIEYSTDKKFAKSKTITIKSNASTGKTVSKLNAKKKYYVRIRTFKTVKGTRLCSSWSKTKSVTTK